MKVKKDLTILVELCSDLLPGPAPFMLVRICVDQCPTFVETSLGTLVRDSHVDKVLPHHGCCGRFGTDCGSYPS